MAPLPELESIVGGGNAFERESAAAAPGSGHFVVEPASVEQLSEVMRLASRERWSVTPIGGGSKMGWGNPAGRVQLVVGTRRISSIVEHSAGDLVVSAQAGLPLEALQRALSPAGQWLALDPPEPRATLGGVIATNASGPRRLRYGTVRDLLIGIRVVLADGTVARAGGKVVKNVAGYDLGKLFTGSLGTLGIVAEATFRLHPLPAASAAIEAVVDGPAGAGEVVRRLLASQLVPSAVELDWVPGEPVRLIVLFEGIGAGVEAQVASALTLLGGRAQVAPCRDEALSARWAEITPRPWQAGDLGLKIARPPGEVEAGLAAIAAATLRRGAAARVRGSAASGVLYAGIGNLDVETASALVRELRAGASDGSTVVLAAPAEIGRVLDAWGPAGAIDLMRRVKQRFDPAGLLNPGRFVGGI